MKKVLVVLLIAVLALGFVFADVSNFTGKLTSKLTWDLDAETLAFTQSAEAKAKFSFGLFAGSSAEKSAQGEGYPYAVIEGALAIDFDDFEFYFGEEDTVRYKADNLWKAYLTRGDSDLVISGPKATMSDDGIYIDGYEEVYLSPLDGYGVNAFKAYDATAISFSWAQDDADDVITTAKIVGENWELDLLKNFGVGNFAKNAVADSFTFKASKKVSTKVAYDMDNSTEDGDGVTFTYDGYKVAVNRFYFDGNNSGNNNFQLSFQTKDFEYEGVTGTLGFNFQSVDSVTSGNISVKAGYTIEDVVLAAASDVRIATEAEDTEFDVAFGANYKDGAVKFDFYYASEADAVSPYENAKDVNKAVLDLSFDYVGGAKYLLKYKTAKDSGLTYAAIGKTYYIEKLMSLKAVVDVAKLADLGPVSALSVTVDGHDILNRDFEAADENNKNVYAWNAEVKGALDDYGTTAKFGVKKFTVEAPARVFYAEATTDFAKFAELPVNTLTLTVGSKDLDMDKNVQDDTDCLYVTVASDINDDLSVSVKGNYLAGVDRTDKIAVKATYTGVEKLTLGASVAHEFAGDVNATEIEATAKYEHDLFTADAKVQTTLYKDSDDNTFGLYVGATSDKIVHGATLSLAYGSLDDDGDVENDWVAKVYGAVVAKCVIAF